MTTKKIYGPWIKWDGGECPVPPDTVVEVKLRCGIIESETLADNLYWSHDGDSSDIVEYHSVTEQFDHGIVGHEPPPPPKRYIGLTVNGRAWVLPEPLRVKPAHDEVVWILSIESWPTRWIWYDCEAQNAALAAGQLYATEADVQAWAEFDKWCRGGGV